MNLNTLLLATINNAYIYYLTTFYNIIKLSYLPGDVVQVDNRELYNTALLLNSVLSFTDCALVR